MASRPKSGRTTNRRASSRGRKPATIDLEAKEVSGSGESKAAANPTSPSKKDSTKQTDVKLGREANATRPTSAASTKSATQTESTKSPSASDRSSAKPDSSGGNGASAKAGNPANRDDSARSGGSSGIFSALMGSVVTVLGLGVVGQFDGAKSIPLIGSLYAGSETVQTVDPDDIQSIRSEINALSSGAADLAPIAERVVALEKQFDAAEGSGAIDQALLGRVEELETQLSSLSQSISAGSASEGGLEEIQTAIASLNERADALELQGTAQQSDQSMAALDEKLAGLESSISTLRSSIAENGQSLEALTSQSGALQDSVASVQASEKIAKSVAVNALGTALENDDSLTLPISSVEALLGEAPETMRLRELDEAGIPSLKALVSGLDDFSGSIEQEATTTADSSLSDRFWANAQKLVSFRATGPRDGDDPFAILSRVRDHVGKGDLADAKGEWTKLPTELKDSGVDWSKKLDARLEAQELYRSISQKLSAAAG